MIWFVLLSLLVPAASAQDRCPEGSTEIRREQVGNKLTIVCRRHKRKPTAERAPAPTSARAKVEGAVALLGQAASGREIAEYLRRSGVQIRVGDLAQGTGAHFDPLTRSITVPSSVKDDNLLHLAAVLGHEGFHAMQVIERRMEGCVEMEIEANFVERAIYHELTRALGMRLPPAHPMEANYVRFARQAERGDLKSFETDIQILYAGHRKEFLTFSLRSRPPWQRSILRALAYVIDAPALYNSQTLDIQLINPFNCERWRGLWQSRTDHERERARERKWLEDHRQEFVSKG